MKVHASPQSLSEFDGSALVVGQSDGDGLGPPLAQLDQLTEGYFSRLLAAEELPTESGKSKLFHQLPNCACTTVLVVGLGDVTDWNEGNAFRSAASAAKQLADAARDRIGFCLGDLDSKLAAAAVAGSINGGVGQDIFREKKNLHPAAQIEWIGIDEAALTRGRVIGEAVLLTRDLVNLPANYMYPETFTARAAEMALSSGLEIEIWDELRLRREGCDALLSVAAGSSRPPRLVMLKYQGKKDESPLALVGKGVTFDSGGLSLKPSDSMISMKCDMAGAATVVGAMQAIAHLQIDTPVVGLVGLVENMISGNSYKLGDVLTARSGKTIEIHNTDAEGRLVLADVLNVALEQSPRGIIDLATLTGACLVALGTDVAGLMSNDTDWEKQIQQAAATAGEDVWPLPMFERYGEQIQSKVADIKNVGEGRWGGAITAAKFLQEFVDDRPWTHIDIAGPAFYDSPKSHLDAGGSGALVRTLIEFAEGL